MEIFGGINQPVSFYNKNTGNTINTIINEENTIQSSNFLYSQNSIKEAEKITKHNLKRKRKSKRLNLIDSEYLPDEALNEAIETDSENNFFVQPKENTFNKALHYIFTNIPLINYFFLKKKSKEIKKTVEKLNDLSQDVDDLMSSPIPYGEGANTYLNIAKNLNNAVSILGEANKKSLL